MTSINIFNDIYTNNLWSDPFSRSGTGSNLLQTKQVRIIIPELIKKYNVLTFLDVPCGDFYWMKEIYPQLENLLNSYIGGDIVEEVVRINNELFSGSIFIFKYLDIKNSVLPNSHLVFCRDCLVHFSYIDILKTIINIKKSKSKYFLTTTFPGRQNKNIDTGNWRPIDLHKFPFYFPKSIEIYSEECSEYEGNYKDKSLELFEIKKINLFRFKIIILIHQILYLIKFFKNKIFSKVR